MQVPDDLRRCVVFIGVEDGPDTGGIRCVGTGFLIGYEQCRYLVTVKHNILPLIDAPYLIRFNRNDGGADNVLIDEADGISWFYHPDPSVDLAIAFFPFDPKKQGHDVLYFGGLENLSSEHGFACGAFCYTIGLFQLMSGKNRNLPVVHTGNLALLPGNEKIQSQIGKRRTKDIRVMLTGFWSSNKVFLV
jgi:hypothetical protein